MLNNPRSELSPFLHFCYLQMIAGWESRRALISFCTEEVDSSLRRRQELFRGQDPKLNARREGEGSFELEVLVRYFCCAVTGGFKRKPPSTLAHDACVSSQSDKQKNQISNEHFVEAIIRRRTLEGSSFPAIYPISLAPLLVFITADESTFPPPPSAFLNFPPHLSLPSRSFQVPL